jgi:hypothetical protein
MSFMDKIKAFFSGGSSAGDDHDHDHDHAGHDHSGHDHAEHEAAAPMPPADPTGMAEPPAAPGTVPMPEPMQPAEPEADRRDDL